MENTETSEIPTSSLAQLFAVRGRGIIQSNVSKEREFDTYLVSKSVK